MRTKPDISNMALFCDFENIALGVRDSRHGPFDIRRVLERLLLKGSIVVKKAYCDWNRYKEFKATMHEAAFELIEIPHLRQSGKNSADIRMVVDALDLCYTKSHVDTFVIISGDSDFSPLVSKLRENDKYVIGIGVRDSTSDLLSANCDEFIFYDDLVREEAVKRKRRSGNAAAASPAPAPAPAQAAPAASPAPAAAGGRRAGGRGARATEPTSDRAGELAEGDALARAVEARAAEEPSASDARAEAEVRGDAERGADSGVAALLRADDSRERDARDAEVREAEVREVEARDDYEPRQQALERVVETVEALIAERGEEDKIWGSMVKQTMKRRYPGFNESAYGYRTFRQLIEDAQRRGLLVMGPDEKAGQYSIRLPSDS